MLPIKKLYLDSRDRTSDSVSESNFRIDLPQVIQMPPNTVFFITDVCIPHVWTTIEAGYNDSLYLWLTNTTLPVEPSSMSYYRVIIPSGIYTAATFAAVLQSSLNAAVGSSMFVCRNTSGTNDLQIAVSPANLSVVILSDTYLTSTAGLLTVSWQGGALDINNLNSANDIIKNYSNQVMDSTHPFNVAFLNLQPINNVYITSPTIGCYDTISTFSNNVIKKVPVSADYGYMIVDQFLAPNDYLDCSRQTLKTLEFHIKDGRGREINLHGSHITFSVVFNKWQEAD